MIPAVGWAQPAMTAAPDSDGTNVSTSCVAADAVDARRDVPVLAFTYTAYGASSHTVGAQTFGTGLLASQQNATLGGGAAVWAAPIERLTLIADARRGLTRDFTPSFAGIVHLYGDAREGFSVGALGKFKIEGFSAGPAGDEVESGPAAHDGEGPVFWSRDGRAEHHGADQ